MRPKLHRAIPNKYIIIYSKLIQNVRQH